MHFDLRCEIHLIFNSLSQDHYMSGVDISKIVKSRCSWAGIETWVLIQRLFLMYLKWMDLRKQWLSKDR